MRTHQAFRFELDPNNVQRAALASHVGAARVAYNFGLNLVRARIAERQRVEEATLGEGLGAREARALAAATVALPWTLPALRREWNCAKAEVAPWWAENSKEAYSSGLAALATALKNFSASRAGRRKGAAMGFPQFKKKSRSTGCRFTTGSLGVVDARHVRLPRVGVLRTKEPTDAVRGDRSGGSTGLPVVEDLLGVRSAKAKPAARRAHVPLRGLRLCRRPRLERRS
jgi:putative transposase